MAFAAFEATRSAWSALAIAGTLLVTAGAASAQYYERYESYGGRSYGYDDGYEVRGGYRGRVIDDYGSVPPRSVGRVSARALGLSQIDRMVETRNSTIVDGQTANGGRARLIFDSRSGALIDRIILQAPTPRAAPRVARVDPREDERPSPRLTPRPPERPAALKPPAQASAPAQTAPMAPIAPPTPGPVAPSGAAKPVLVNPNDVRGLATPERTPPLAKVETPVISVPPVVLPPVQIDGLPPSPPRAATPDVPVAPLE